MAEQSDIKSKISHAGAAIRSPRGKRIGKWLGGGLLAFGLFGFLAAPPLLKSLLLKQLSQELHREVSIADISINPFALSAKLDGVSIKAGDGKEVAGFDELFVNLSSFSIFQAGIVVDELRLKGPRVAVTHLGGGRYDISDLLDEWMKPKDEPDKPIPRFSVNNIQVSDGKFVFDDRAKAKVHTISDLNFGLPFVSSMPYQAEVLVQPSFSATIDGSQLALKGRSKPFAGTHESELDLDLDRFDLAGVQAYLPDSLPFRLGAGKLDSELKVVFKEVSDQVYSLTVVGAAHVADFALNEVGGQALAGWKRLDIELDSADLINRRIAVKQVALDGLDARLAVNAAGEMNVLQVLERLAAKPAGKTAAAPAEPAAPLAWSLGGFVLSNGLVHWQDASRPEPVNGEIRNLAVKVGKLDSKLAEPIEIAEASYQLDLGERLRIEKMQAKGIKVDLPAHRVDVAEVINGQTRARMLRNKEGGIEWLNPPLLKTVHAADSKLKDEKPWVANLARLKVEDLAFRFEDQATRPAAVQELEGFLIEGENLGNESGHKGKLLVQGKINKKGSLKLEGPVQLMPLNVALKLETRDIALMPMQAYFNDYLNVALTRGQISSQGEIAASQEKDILKAAYKGSLTVGDFLAVDKVNSADFLKWKSLFLGGIDFKLEPMAVNVAEIALSDFYSRLILNKDGHLNVADIVRKPGEEAVNPAEAKASVSQAGRKPAKPGTKPLASPGKGEAPKLAKAAVDKRAADKPAAEKAPMPIKIAKITLQNGTVNFSDFFVKPNYTVNVAKLGGRITGLSSAADTVADLELRGSYANSAPVVILAKLNPLAAKTFLDLKAEISGVDLTGFSPYAGKYAGYNIEKGKLSLNVAYKLENNQLTADNRLFIDQFTFGDKVESPDATTLPVNLAVSLLKNNRGEIDINLPISGSLDDPQFSVGGLIVKVIVNLFVKAVTSPFALLGSMFGGGEELSNLEFAAGRAHIDEAAGKKLEALAKALNERSALKLEIAGRADPEADKEGIKRVAIERAMKAEKLKDTLKKGGEGNSLDSIEIAPEEYKTYLTRAYKEAKFPKPRNLVGMQKDLPVEEMEKLMLTNLPATDDDVRALAERRAQRVQTWLVEQGKVPLARIFLLPPKVEADGKGKASRVDFSLR